MSKPTSTGLFEMATDWAWVRETLSRHSNARSQRATTRVRVLLATGLVLVLLILGFHLGGSHLPSISGSSKSPSPAHESNAPVVSQPISPPSDNGGDDEPPSADESDNHDEHTDDSLTQPDPVAEAAPAAPTYTLKAWTPPDMDALIHGTKASDGIKKKPEYELKPFPHSPMAQEPEDDGKQRPWLGAVICSAFDIKRRMLIRYTWMKIFKNVPMDKRFVISNPGPMWTEVIQQENRTYGDMIVLDHLPENDFTANTIKTVEFYRWLVNNNTKKYEFVSKMDTDLFVNAQGYYDRQLKPRLEKVSSSSETLRAAVNHTIVGQFFYDGYHKTSFPHGAIYTVTWDIVELLPRLQDKFHVIAGEDVTMAWLLMKGHQKVTMAVLSEAEKFEWDRKDTRPGPKASPWARKDTDLTSHWHGLNYPDALAIHQLKKDEDWLNVANCFNETGMLEPPKEPEKAPPKDDDKPGYPKPWFHDIPADFWEVDYDGTLLCNGVWKLEPGVDKDMKKKNKGDDARR